MHTWIRTPSTGRNFQTLIIWITVPENGSISVNNFLLLDFFNFWGVFSKFPLFCVSLYHRKIRENCHQNGEGLHPAERPHFMCHGLYIFGLQRSVHYLQATVCSYKSLDTERSFHPLGSSAGPVIHLWIIMLLLLYVFLWVIPASEFRLWGITLRKAGPLVYRPAPRFKDPEFQKNNSSLGGRKYWMNCYTHIYINKRSILFIYKYMQVKKYGISALYNSYLGSHTQKVSNTQRKAIRSITINIAFFTQSLHLFLEYNASPILCS